MNTQKSKRAYWFEQITEQKKSGLSRSEFCRQKGLAIARLHYYSHCFKKPVATKESQAKYVPIQLTSLTKQKVIEPGELRLILRNGLQCVLPCEVDVRRVQQLAEALLTC